MATTRDEALLILEDFIKNKFELFGPYEDAIDTRDPFLYHSVLSPYINIGFLTPEEIVKKVLKAKVDIASKEGFIRQIIGWREFMCEESIKSTLKLKILKTSLITKKS
jgi:deoxyribodipyrimidine photolyase-related protein